MLAALRLTRPRLLLLLALIGIIVAALLVYGAVRAGWTWQGWTAVASIATLLAVLVALALGIWGDELRTLGRSPRLSLTLQPTPDHFQRFLTAAGAVLYSVRISVTNEGEIGAKNVEVVAQELSMEEPGGHFMRDPVFMAMNLTRTHYGDTITPIVHRGIPRPYDLLSCLDPTLQQPVNQPGRKELRFDLATVVAPVAVQPILAKPVALPDAYPSSKLAGTYRLQLAVVADGIAPVLKVVEITWSGKWWDHAEDFFKNQLTVRLL